jgi:trk system potassium uptake protein TrkH
MYHNEGGSRGYGAPLLISLYNGEYGGVYGFAVAIIMLLALSLLTYIKRPKNKMFYARDGLLIVALGWIVVSVFGPYLFMPAGPIPRL